ncbi:endonuclease domain-containing protein [Novosphingobium mangrovi (ex Huang et al. 2023)]|uniref:Endonuclease domain-containing protein n=1 Tax=Novosphingobium mangrovi (ex Huang et al. 2023) TaxID=2976432 RepID=A0ABT2I2W5_9SPHN|nr:endonuclease domain-containing protein [Novosphingobium mangrovi (ex Huang et al. 2023)]MCT2399142.1 endonuclease domain-containing protein [Novosphingobium mangrovi (ex Huang et al. 2023)]
MFKDVAPKPKAGGIARARKLRSAMSLPEGLLWRELRKRPGGLKFRRQHPSGAYVLDFYCADARLAVEVDGMAHGMGDNPARDEARDRWFSDAGIATLRIPARAVLDDLEAVTTLIVTEAQARLPLHHPAAPGGPPPRDELGEE